MHLPAFVTEIASVKVWHYGKTQTCVDVVISDSVRLMRILLVKYFAQWHIHKLTHFPYPTPCHFCIFKDIINSTNKHWKKYIRTSGWNTCLFYFLPGWGYSQIKPIRGLFIQPTPTENPAGHGAWWLFLKSHEHFILEELICLNKSIQEKAS